MANAGTVGKPSVPSVPLVAPLVSIVPRACRVIYHPSLVPIAVAVAVSPLRSRPSSTPPPLHRLAICPSLPPPVNQPPMPAFFWIVLSLSPLLSLPPRCPHFPWAHSQHFGIPKGEYNDFKRVVQLTTQKFCEQCNDPRNNSDPRTYILQYRICFADAHSPTYNLSAVFDGLWVLPPSSPPSSPSLHVNGVLSRSSAYPEVSSIPFNVLFSVR